MAQHDRTVSLSAGKSPALRPGHVRTASSISKNSPLDTSYEASPFFRAVTASPSTPFRQGLDTWEGLDAEDYAKSDLFGTFRTTQTPRLRSQHTSRVAGVEDLFGSHDAEDLADIGTTSRLNLHNPNGTAAHLTSPSATSEAYDAEMHKLEALLGQLRGGGAELNADDIQNSLSDVIATMKSRAVTQSPSLSSNSLASPPLFPLQETHRPLTSMRTSQMSTPATTAMTASPALSSLSIASSIRSTSQVLQDLKAEKRASEAKLKAERARIKAAKVQEAALRSATKELWKLDEQKLKAEKEQLAAQQRLEVVKMQDEHRQRYLENEKAFGSAIMAQRDQMMAAHDAVMEETAKKLQAAQSPAVAAASPSAANVASPKAASVASTPQTAPMQTPLFASPATKPIFPIAAPAASPAAQSQASPMSGLTIEERNKVFLYLTHLLQGGQPIQGYQNLLRRYYYEHPDKALLQQLDAVRQMDALRAHSAQQMPSSSGMVSPSPPLVPLAGVESDMGMIAASLLRKVVEDCEESRHIAYERHLDFKEVNKAKLVELTLVATPELSERANSTRRLVVSIYPTPVPRNPKFQDILHAQLRAAVSLFQLAARDLGAQAVTNLRFQQGTSAGSADMGKVAGLIVQYKTLGPGSPVSLSPLDTGKPFSLHKRVPLPPGLLKKDHEYELFIETLD